MNAELNAKTAEVMGWELSNDGECWLGVAGEIIINISNWNPSENFDHALKCVEKFTDLGAAFELGKAPFSLWRASLIVTVVPKKVTSVMFGENPAEAICLAVIEADKKLKDEEIDDYRKI